MLCIKVLLVIDSEVEFIEVERGKVTILLHHLMSKHISFCSNSEVLRVVVIHLWFASVTLSS